MSGWLERAALPVDGNVCVGLPADYATLVVCLITRLAGELPNLNVALFDKLACMLQRGGVIGRHEA